MANSKDKQTIYIDVDDDITTIIDKVSSSSGKIAALVLPKRSTVLQSIVNMKLLKKASQEEKKNIVLITSEVGLLPLAGVAGLHVAKSLQSKPAIPMLPNETLAEVEEMDEEVPLDTSQSATELEQEQSSPQVVSNTAVEAAAPAFDEDETIELDNTEQTAAVNDDTGEKSSKAKLTFKIPNFENFRLRLILGGLIVLALIGLYIFGTVVMPRASVNIKTDSSTIASNPSFTVNTEQTDFLIDKALLPATQKEVKKTDSEKVAATGQKDNGTKASGSVTAFNCTDNDINVPAGTGFSSGSLTYISSAAVVVPASDFNSSGVCKKNRSATISVIASSGGANFNLESGRSFTSSLSNTLTGVGAAMTGGTTSIIKVVSQTDIDTALGKLKGRQDEAAKRELADLLKTDGLMLLNDSLVISEPAITPSPAVGEQADNGVTVTSVTTYTALGVKNEYLSQLVKKDVSGKLDQSRQVVLDDGLLAASFKVNNRKSPTNLEMSLSTNVIVGPDLNADKIKLQIKGKKKGEAKNLIDAQTGVTEVNIKLSPFWVYKLPGSPGKIKIIIEKPEVKAGVRN